MWWKPFSKGPRRRPSLRCSGAAFQDPEHRGQDLGPGALCSIQDYFSRLAFNGGGCCCGLIALRAVGQFNFAALGLWRVVCDAKAPGRLGAARVDVCPCPAGCRRRLGTDCSRNEQPARHCASDSIVAGHRRTVYANDLGNCASVGPVPAGATEWSAERRRAVLSHELAHIARHDWLAQICGELVCGFYWFHPLVWFAAAGLRAESECACDDSVLNSGVEASNYANQLVELARALKNAHRGG